MRVVTVHDRLQKDYRYELSCPEGEQFDYGFEPDLTPQQMLSLGVFGGKYMTDCQDEFPSSWFQGVDLRPRAAHAEANFFKVLASQSLSEWRRKGWIYPEDPRGWFQWYCRYYLGRRIPPEDARQIKRWRAMRRHIAQLEHACAPGDILCRPRQRQALLQWAYDSRRL
jgi:hypothetical protein